MEKSRVRRPEPTSRFYMDLEEQCPQREGESLDPLFLCGRKGTSYENLDHRVQRGRAERRLEEGGLHHVLRRVRGVAAGVPGCARSAQDSYVAKTLIRHRLRKFESLIPVPDMFYKELARAKTVDAVRQIEAKTSARYWEAWFEKLEVEASRRDNSPLIGCARCGFQVSLRRHPALDSLSQALGLSRLPS